MKRLLQYDGGQWKEYINFESLKGKDVDMDEIYMIAESSGERSVEQHEKRFNHLLLHDPFMLGTKMVNEATLGKDRFLQYDGKNLIFADILRAKEGKNLLPYISAGGGVVMGNRVTSGTEGSVLFVGADSLLTQDNANFFWDNTNNRLGLGNAAPGTTLDITGTLRASSTVTFSTFTANGGALFTNGSGVLAQSAAGTATQVLHGGATPSFSAISLTADVTGILPIANGGTNNSSAYTAGSIIFSNGTSLTQDNANLFFDDTNNRLGIGTASPSTALHVAGTGVLRLSAMTAGSVLFAGTSGDVSQDNANLFFNDTNNRLGIGTTAPETNLHVFNGSAGTVTTFPNSLLTLENSTHSYINLLVPTGEAAGLIIGQGTNSNFTALTFNRVIANAWDISSATAGFLSAFYIRNSDNTDPGSSANMTLFVGGANAGDVYMLYTVSGVISWSLGVDNSDGDKFKLSTAALPGGGDVLTVTTAGLVGISSSSTPGAQLEVDASTAATKGLIVKGAATQSANLFEAQNSASSILAQIDANGAFVFNEQGADADCRIEGDTEVNLIYTDASTDRVGIGTSTPQGRFDITTAATNDDPNYWFQQARVTTTDATQTTLDTFAITASRTYVIEARVVARRTGGAAGTADDGAAYVVRAAYTTKAGTVTLLGLVNADYTAEDQVLFDATFTISGANVLLSVTGVAANNLVWHSTSIVSFVGT